ncbi:MAG: class I SAM-dependent rRNA methyltransferase [Planctomycetota bacterium]
MSGLPDALIEHLARARAARAGLVERLRAEHTDCWRWFHGATEGIPGLAVDRYGELLIAQLFRSAAAEWDVAQLAATIGAFFATPCAVVDRRDGHRAATITDAATEREVIVREGDVRMLVRAAHRGLDPWLFLDFRAGRRRIAELARGRSVLNLFAYTCTAGLVAQHAGAVETWNVDFASSSLAVGERNLALNELVPSRVRFLREDCLVTLRQLAGQTVGRRHQTGDIRPRSPRHFDLVVLDPPRLARGKFGKIDVVHDYQSLFKPAWLVTADGGHLLATNHVAAVERDVWIESLHRCARKAGRPIRELEVIAPDEDFPSPDGRPPLKLALCSV